MKTQYINYTPIPAQVPRQLAIEILQSHGEIITLNPLVLEYHPIKAPRDCPNDEYYSTWYEITERIQFVPGFKKMGSSKVTFKGCFHDMPWGVQTHMYVPMGVDLRNKWQIKGSQPGEPPEPRELGSAAPSSGLYLKEEVDIKCNPLAVSFIKKEMKASALIMVERMIKKAELLDAGVLHAMFENGKLKTFNPADKSQQTVPGTPITPGPMSPGFPKQSMPLSPGFPPQSMPLSPGYPPHWRQSTMPQCDQNMRTSSYNGSQYPNIAQHPSQPQYPTQYATYPEGPNQYGHIAHPEGKGVAVEMPGDFRYPSQQITLSQPPSDRRSQVSGSDHSHDHRDSRWSYVSSERHSEVGGPQSPTQSTSPVNNPTRFTAELPGSGHKDFEANQNTSTPPLPPTSPKLPSMQSSMPPPPPTPPPTQTQQPMYGHQTYNPQNYARFAGNSYA